MRDKRWDNLIATPSKWRHKKTVPIRIPEIAKEQVMEVAKRLDSGERLVVISVEELEGLYGKVLRSKQSATKGIEYLRRRIYQTYVCQIEGIGNDGR